MDAQTQSNEVRAQLLSLQHLAMPELTEKWKLLFHKDPPEYGEIFMRRRLAHRVQELAYGGLNDTAQKKLNSVNGRIRRAHSGLRVGTVIVRTWRDAKYEVRVCKDGFEWNGQIFNSLSATARAITGVNRNGYEFFGIKDKIHD